TPVPTLFPYTTLFRSFLTFDLVPWVESRYRVVPKRSGRAALGISMGGYGALHWAFLHPDLFSVVGGLSPAVETLNWKTMTGMPRSEGTRLNSSHVSIS